MIRRISTVLVLLTALFALSGCATNAELRALRTEVSELRSEAQAARVAAENAASDAASAKQEAQRAAGLAASAQSQAALANERAERVYVRSLSK